MMTKRFACQFAVGEDGQACSGVWRVWAAKNWPDLYLTALGMGGQIKASIHLPRRARSIPIGDGIGDSISEPRAMLRKQQKETAAPTRSCPVGPDCTLEWRINFPGSIIGDVIPSS
jgi:hypothetical protein